MTRLYAIQHDLPTILWCGPAAVAAVTGAPTSRIVEIIRANRGERDGRARAVTYTWPAELIHALHALGRDSYWTGMSMRGEPTFAQFRKARTTQMRARALIVLVTGHFLVLAGNRFMDSRQREPILATQWSGQRRRVQGYITV
jgi:hypothetical protein